ncbi:MAG TPA: glycosyltransferase family 4 protein [Candidatus Acidoferrum sp.]|jgi:glycosyltransferase involved in cell wall biosynthesis
MIPLIVDLDTEWRGGQNQALLLLKGLYERGHAAELLTAKGSSLGRRAKRVGIYVHEVSRGMLRVPAAIKIRGLISDGRVDLIHANEAHAVTAAWLAGAHRSIPLVISRRVGYPIGRSQIARARYRAATCVVANSNWVAEQAANSGVPVDRLHVVYEGVEVPELPSPTQREVARARWGIRSTHKVLGCVGALQADKGHEWVIRALAELQQECPECRLLIAGNGKYRPHLEELVEELGLRQKVIFAGFLKDISAVYEALDIFIFPSLFEGLGTSLLAAMGYGVPSITFFGCALGEIVESGRSGLQVEARNPRQIADAVAALLRDESFASEIAKSGRERVVEKFSADRMVEQMVQIYEEVLGTNLNVSG